VKNSSALWAHYGGRIRKSGWSCLPPYLGSVRCSAQKSRNSIRVKASRFSSATTVQRQRRRGDSERRMGKGVDLHSGSRSRGHYLQHARILLILTCLGIRWILEQRIGPHPSLWAA